MGPGRGIDQMAVEYIIPTLPKEEVVGKISVFFYQGEDRMRKNATWVARLHRAGVKLVVKGRGHTERDEAMTRQSDYDILKYLTDEECRVLYGASYRPRISGTQKNEIRRRKLLRREEEAGIGG